MDYVFHDLEAKKLGGPNPILTSSVVSSHTILN